MKLEYKASNIRKTERENGKNFFAVISSLGETSSVDDLMFVWEAGGGSDDAFDAEFSKGIQNILLIIMEGINEAGFLGHKIDMTELKKAMEASMGTSQSSGEAKKA